MKSITVHCVARPEKRNDLISLCKGMIAPSRAETGCLHYSFYQDLNEGNRFFFYEEWKDQASIDLHNTTKHFLEFQPIFKNFTVGDAIVTVHQIS